MSASYQYNLYAPPAYASARHAVADPHHFVLFQHGVMGYAGDFENVIADLFVHHDVSLHEAYEAAERREARRAAKERERAMRRQRQSRQEPREGAASERPSSLSPNDASPSSAAGGRPGHGEQVPGGVSSPCAAAASHAPRHRREKERTAAEDAEDESEESGETKQCVARDRREAQQRAARREEYKINQFSLERSYPFRQRGRLYQTGNLVCFAPGSNNFLGTGAGTLPCARRMLAEFLPVFQAWLDRVEAARRAEDAAFGDTASDGSDDSDGDRARPRTDGSEGMASSPTAAAAAAAAMEAEDDRLSSAGPAATFLCASHDVLLREHLPSRSSHGSAPTPSASSSPWLASPTMGLAAVRHGHARDRRRLPRRLPICFSCVGHSFGGLILREFLFLLCVDTMELPQHEDPALYAAVLTLRLRMMKLHVHFENFVTVATPHCGTTECLWAPIYLGAWCLAKLRIFPTYGELIVSDSEAVLMKRLVDTPHVTALKLFRRRTLFANTHRDLLVGFGTSALIFESHDDDHTKVKGYGRCGDVPCAAAFDSDDAELSAAIYLPADTAGERQGQHATATASRLPPNSSKSGSTHTLFDIWEFHHTQSTTTLSPVDPFAILAPAAAAAADALTASVTAAAAATMGKESPTNTAPARAKGKGRGVEDEEEEEHSGGAGAAATGPWYHYDLVFPQTTGVGGGVGSTAWDAARRASGGGVSTDDPQEHDRPARAAVGGGRPAVSVVDPAIPPPTMQFPLTQIISPADLRDKLRDALSSSFSATVVTSSPGRRDAEVARAQAPLTSGSSRHKERSHPEANEDKTDSLSTSSMGTSAFTTTTAITNTTTTSNTMAGWFTGGRTSQSALSGWTWIWPSRASFLRYASFGSTGREKRGAGQTRTTPHDAARIEKDGVSGKPRSAFYDARRGWEGTERSRGRADRRDASSQRQRRAALENEAPLTTPSSPARRRRHFSRRQFGPLARAEDDSVASLLTIPMRLMEACTQEVPQAARSLAARGWRRVSRWFRAHGGDGWEEPAAREGSGASQAREEAEAVHSGAPDGSPTEPISVSAHGEFAQRPGESEEEYLRRLLLAHMQRLPRSRLTPRAIARELRRDLDWRVRAVRWSHVIPIAHVVSLGNWAWAGTSPNLVKAVAEEIAHIL